MARWARVVTEVMAPVVLVVVVTFVVAIHAAGSGRGLLLGVVAMFFAAGLPYAILQVGIRRGVLGDRHLTQRHQGPVMMTIGLVSIVVGLLALSLLDAPRALFALVWGICAAVAVCLAVTLRWKISIHTACAGGVVAALAVLVNPWLLVVAPLVVLVAWSRVGLGDHTTRQVVVGAAVGFGVAALVTLALS
jgi:membrane-associated phospholipid phosphatase